MKRWLLAGLMLACRLNALEIAEAGAEPFDLPLEPTLAVSTDKDAWAEVSLGGWADRSLGEQSLDAEALGSKGQVLRRMRDLYAVPAFAFHVPRQVLVPVPAGTRALRLRVRGQGPAVGAWNLGGDSPKAFRLFELAESAARVGGEAIELRAEAGSDSVELRGRSALLGRLRWSGGWTLRGSLQQDPSTSSDQAQVWLLQGPAGQLCALGLITAYRNGIQPSLQMTLRFQGPQPRTLALWFEPVGQGDWLLPFNQGLRVPVDQAQGLDPGYDLDMRAGHFISMPALGWSAPQGSVLFWSNSPADLALRLRLAEKKAAWVFRPSQQAWETASLEIHLLPPGAEAWAQKIRDLQGPLRGPTLGDLPERFKGAVNIHYWKKAAWWTPEARPEALAAEMKRAGLDRVLWSQKVAPEAVTPMAALGWCLGSYENFQDVYPSDTPLAWTNKEGWPEQAVLRANGDWVRGWPAKDGGKTYYAGVRSSRAAVDYVHAQLSARKRHGQQAVFLDTTTATGPVEDWSLEHPMSRTEDLYFKKEQLSYGTRLGLIVGSESGHDGALGAAHYFEGMQSPWVGRFDDAGYELASIKPASEAMQKWNLSPRYRAPLFDLAWHDSYVGYEYWGDAANRLPEHWRRKDLFSVLYAQPQLWVMDEERWAAQKAQAIKSYATWSPVVRHLFGQRMTDWKVLDANGDVQETHWEDGSVVRVDFAHDRITLQGPVKNPLD